MNKLHRLTSIQNLPTLPEISLRIQKMVNSDEGDAVQLSRIIQEDPALSARILKVANSSLFGATKRISSIPFAITRIGFNEVGNIALAVSIIKEFPVKSNVLDYKLFWKHALTAAHMASKTAQVGCIEFTPDQRHALFLAGLLHDIGILIYDQFFHAEFESIIDYAIKHEVSYLEAEQAVAPKENHAALGAALLEFWKLDPAVISGVRFHHTPQKAPMNYKATTSSTYLSEYILCNSGLGSFEGLMIERADDTLKYLNLTPDILMKYIQQAESDVKRSDLVMAMETSGETLQLRTV
ncbi:MAG: HDOD domain-containing protein [Chitinispirillaceae bacterium]